MTGDIVCSAARNNALWCDAVCRAHGGAGEFAGGLWFSRQETPRFYPDAVTIEGVPARAAQFDVLDAVMAAHPRHDWAVKDSFSTLDLSSRGFNVLFDAQWICREPSAVPRGHGDLRWVRVTSAASLRSWEQALTGDPEADDRTGSLIFAPPLLTSAGIALFTAERGGAVVGGGALNAAANAVGVSNVFGAPSDRQDIWHGLLAQAAQLYPGTRIVGYERGEGLDVARSVGCDAIGPLRVWIRS
ncbi:hypothetical protein [Reyranella sp. CPCC 100927]|uniref:hypothetical protein n=1 Tax=Reyranella sp. CPCC 100927 TaxID=2599616 RepID=UPI0011B47099|nr:hypothetical protein [Reyranella sp. CPCC 100927]TWT04076.1 hypothetical protein FQU96_27210 [Reyranella sp. CPCC 100927]